MERWIQGNYFEQRAAMAAVCEPRLLTDAASAPRIFTLLDRITAGLASANNRPRRWLPGIAQSPGIRLECSGVSFS